MPKGQYTRKPRSQAPEAVAETARPPVLSLPPGTKEEMQELMNSPAPFSPIPESEPFRFEPNEVQARMIAEEQAKAERVVSDERLAELNAGAAEPAHETFADWVAEDLPPLPNDGMVQRKVSGWAGAVCPIRHAVIWQPAKDGRAIEVMLTTDHGTNRMVQPAGCWTEADIDAALEAMTKELGA